MAGICLLSHNQVREWERTGKRPPCQFHHHTSYKKAMMMVEHDEALNYLFVRAVVQYDCVRRYRWTGALSDCTQVMQLLPIR